MTPEKSKRCVIVVSAALEANHLYRGGWLFPEDDGTVQEHFRERANNICTFLIDPELTAIEAKQGIEDALVPAPHRAGVVDGVARRFLASDVLRLWLLETGR